MRIGIIVHSHTGNTLSIAQKLKEILEANGNSVNLEQVTAVNENPSEKNIQLKSIPDTEGYDALIFGAPVWAFSLSPVMKAYLSQLPSLSGKKVSCFVTQQLPYPFMGGNRAIKEFKKGCEIKGTDVSETGIVNWSSKQREKKISDIIQKFSRL